MIQRMWPYQKPRRGECTSPSRSLRPWWMRWLATQRRGLPCPVSIATVTSTYSSHFGHSKDLWLNRRCNPMVVLNPIKK